MEILLDSLSGSILDIMTWVVFSVLFFEVINIFTKNKLYTSIEKAKYFQPLYGSFLGSVPGCSGPIIITNLYNKRMVSLGTLTATFIATFGDAAFVILAFSPLTFLYLWIISLVVGLIFGYLLDLTPLGKKIQKWIDSEVVKEKTEEEVKKKFFFKNVKKKNSLSLTNIDTLIMPSLFLLLIILILPGSFINMFYNSNDIENILKPDIGVYKTESLANYMMFINWLSIITAVIFIIYYIFIKFIKNFFYFSKNEDRRDKIIVLNDEISESSVSEIAHKNPNIELDKKFNYFDLQYETFINSIFILFWVFTGLLIFSLLFNPFESFWNKVFSNVEGVFLGILFGVIVGFLPGCGPQIAFANIYIGGMLSFPAIAANSINQDGDAEFPLIATEQRTFIVMGIINGFAAFITGFIVWGIMAIAGDPTAIWRP